MTDAPRKLMCVVELTVEDAVTVGMTLRSLAHTRLADASAAERLERVGRAMVTARAAKFARAATADGVQVAQEFAPDDVAEAGRTLSAWRASALEARARVAELEARIKEFQDGISEYSSEAARYKAERDALAGTPDPRVAKLEIELAMMRSAEARPLIVAAAAWVEAEKALALANAAATACEDALDAAKGDVEAKRRSDNAGLWCVTCVRAEEKAAQVMRDAAKRLAARPKYETPRVDASIVRIVRGAACVTGEARETGGWHFACQVCDANWNQPDSSDVTAIAHMQLKHREDAEATPSAP